MTTFLTEAWITALDDAARSVAGADEALVIQQIVTDDEGEVTWHIAFDGDGVRVRPGRADAADVTFTQARATAESIARGELSAGSALTSGLLTVQGATARLTAHREDLARLDQALAAVRADA